MTEDKERAVSGGGPSSDPLDPLGNSINLLYLELGEDVGHQQVWPPL